MWFGWDEVDWCIARRAAAAAGFWYGLSKTPIDDGPIIELFFVPPGVHL